MNHRHCKYFQFSLCDIYGGVKENCKRFISKVRLPINVIISSMELAGIGWFTSLLSTTHTYMFGEPIRWRYEISRFEATRERRPLPQGWSTVWNADPEVLVNRGFEKVITIQKNLEDACYSHALYMRPHKTYEEIVDFEPRFLNIVKSKWIKYEQWQKFEHENHLALHLDDLNNHTTQMFTRVLDFLGFPKEGRPLYIPVPVYRDWERYSNINHKKEDQVPDPLKKIKWIKNVLLRDVLRNE